MASITTTIITCDCCGFSFADGSGEPYRHISFPVNGATEVRVFCISRGCDLHLSEALLAVADDHALTHQADVVPALTPLAAAPTITTSTSGGGGSAATTYYYKVSVLSRAGETVTSPEASTIIPPNGTATLSWPEVTGAVGYRIYRTETTGAYPGNALIGQADAPDTTFTDTNINPPTATPLPTADTSAGIAIVTVPYPLPVLP